MCPAWHVHMSWHYQWLPIWHVRVHRISLSNSNLMALRVVDISKINCICLFAPLPHCLWQCLLSPLANSVFVVGRFNHSSNWLPVAPASVTFAGCIFSRAEGSARCMSLDLITTSMLSNTNSRVLHDFDFHNVASRPSLTNLSQ